MNTEKELKKTIVDPLRSTTAKTNCATGMTPNALEDWREGGKPCPKCGSFHTQKNIAMCLTTYPCQYHFRCMNCSHTWTDHEWYDGGLSYQPQPESPNPFKEYGWICPKCGRVYSPSTNQCLYCGGGYQPNIIYCGPNSGTKDPLDTIYTAKDVLDIIDTVNTAKNYTTQNTQSNNLKYESFKQQHGE